jgi:hypothetical protein
MSRPRILTDEERKERVIARNATPETRERKREWMEAARKGPAAQAALRRRNAIKVAAGRAAKSFLKKLEAGEIDGSEFLRSLNL